MLSSDIYQLPVTHPASTICCVATRPYHNLQSISFCSYRRVSARILNSAGPAPKRAGSEISCFEVRHYDHAPQAWYCADFLKVGINSEILQTHAEGWQHSHSSSDVICLCVAHKGLGLLAYFVEFLFYFLDVIITWALCKLVYGTECAFVFV